MAVVKAREQDIDLLARLLRAEAEGEGEQGMLMVGNVGINRIRANCSDFVGLRTIPQMVYQPHAFEATITRLLLPEGARKGETAGKACCQWRAAMALKVSLWYFRPPGDCPPTWYDQPFVGRYKQHCFYEPTGEECENIYNTF